MRSNINTLNVCFGHARAAANTIHLNLQEQQCQTERVMNSVS